jgi:hypothetical protein
MRLIFLKEYLSHDDEYPDSDSQWLIQELTHEAMYEDSSESHPSPLSYHAEYPS